MASPVTAPGPDSGNAGQARCVACREPIQPGARRCPHCQSPQRPEKIKLVAVALKWVAGATALISLLIGSASVYRLYEGWTERRTAVAELVAASRIQLASRDYEGGWALLHEALGLDPASRSVRQFQIPFAMDWLRHIRVPQGKSFSDFVDPLLPVLYRGASDARPSFAADVYAHIGWANYLKRRSGDRLVAVDRHFAKALSLDPDNVYANAFSAHWMLNRLNPRAGAKRSVLEARRRFDVALKSGKDRPFVINLALAATLDAGEPVATRETLLLANKLRKAHVPVRRDMLIRIARLFQVIAATNPEFAKAKLTEMAGYVAVSDLREIFDWARRGIAPQRPMPEATGQYIAGRLAEAADDRAAALLIYRRLVAETPPGSNVIDLLVRPALRRLEGRDK